MGRRALLVLAALALVAVWIPRGGRAPAQDAPPALTSALPAWVAPGGRLILEGTAAAGAPVAVLAGGQPLGETTAAGDGRFRLRVRAPGAGLHGLVLESGTALVDAGRLRVRPLVLAAVGDVNLGDRVGLAVSTYGVRYPWLSVAPALSRADLAVANLECAVSTRGAPLAGKQYTFRGRPGALIAAGRFAGLDVVSLANNHSLDYGHDAFIDTIRHATRAGISVAGGGSSLAAARTPAVREAGGLRIAFLAYSDVRPLGFDAGAGIAGTTPAFPEIVAPDVRRARRAADVVIVYFHWGEERMARPNVRQRALAQLALSSGATIVLGAHPHVLQPLERPRPRRLVAWSLGNFVFGATSPGTRRTGILLVRLGATGVLGHGFRRAVIGGSYGVQPQLVRR
ncbi:MAG TPA: CapA family protein [Gaiellaceae bacterium]|nr:CapA family protein [Gaiellaceae bacterium]